MTKISQEELERLYSIYLANPHVSTDSRKITEGDIFFALKGDNFDANMFASTAIRLGASCAVIDDLNLYKNMERYSYSYKKLFYVPNVLDALQALAQLHTQKMKERGLRIFSLTGTNGKTTTKNLVAEVLKTKYKVVATQGNLNNHIGVPLTLLSITPETQVAVVEMGASHKGEIAHLVKMVNPDCGLITNVGKGHLEGFGSLDGVMETKGALYDNLISHQGTIFYDSENQLLKSMLTERYALDHAIPYGKSAMNAEIKPNSIFLSFSINGADVNTHLVGAYNFMNCLAAIRVGAYFGIPQEQAIAAIEAFEPQNIRSQFISTEKNDIIADAYNANPVSMRLAVESFSAITPQEGRKRKIAILGNMLELGADSPREHALVVSLLQQSPIEKVFWVGELFADIVPSANHFPKVEQLIEHLQSHPITNATILLKGSRGTKLEKLLDIL